MTTLVITETLKDELLKFLKKNRKADLITTYLFFLEKKFNIKPVLFGREKMIYQSQEELIQKLESQGKLWRETEIKIQFGEESVNDQTKKIYICPFTGKFSAIIPTPIRKMPFMTGSLNARKIKRGPAA